MTKLEEKPNFICECGGLNGCHESFPSKEYVPLASLRADMGTDYDHGNIISKACPNLTPNQKAKSVS